MWIRVLSCNKAVDDSIQKHRLTSTWNPIIRITDFYILYIVNLYAWNCDHYIGTDQGPASLRLMLSQFKDIVNNTKIKASKLHILRYMGSKFCVKFQRCPLKFTQSFEPIHLKICILRGVKCLTTYDILDLWYLKSYRDLPWCWRSA